MKKKRLKQPTRLRIKRFDNDLYWYTVFVGVGGTEKDAIKWFEKTFKHVSEWKEARPHRYAMMVALENDKSHLLWFREKPGGGVAAHEALHSVAHVLRLSGVKKLEKGNEECWAYLLEWTMKKLGNIFW